MDAHPNIELRLYNPFRNRGGVGRAFELLWRLFSVNHRMHNKAWIADGRVAIIGGRNIGEQYFSAGAEVNFRDLDLLLLGPAVQQASTIFDATGTAPPRCRSRRWAQGIRRRCATCLPTSIAMPVASAPGAISIAWPIRRLCRITIGARCIHTGAQASRSSPTRR